MKDTQLQLNHHTLSRLPCMPEVLVRLMKELNSENLNVSVLQEIIAFDPALTLKVMSIANLPIYSRHQEITSISQAVESLGIKRIKIIVLSASLQQLTNKSRTSSTGALNTFWIHAMGSALLSREIALRISYPEPNEAYIAGMLHDIGRLALLGANSSDYLDFYHIHHQDEDRLIEMEMRQFGISHAEAGARLFKGCHLEPLVIEAVLNHHAPAQRIQNATELAKILHLANALSNISGVYDHPALSLANALFGMSIEETLKLCLDSQRKVLDLACLLNVPLRQDKNSATSAHLMNDGVSHAETIFAALGSEINHASILSQARECFDTSFDEKLLLETILQSASIIFETEQACFFELDKHTNLLAGRPMAGQADSLRRIRFPLELNKSKLADALLWNAVTRPSIGTDGSMLDEQIIRSLGTRNLLCVPMISNNFMYGTLVLAFPDQDTVQPEAQTRFALAFGNLAASCIQQYRQNSDKESNSTAESSGLDEYKLNIRKVVHEVNNPLAIMKNYLKVLDIKLASNLGEPVEEIRVINEEIDRISNILRRLFSAPDTASSSPVDVNAVVTDVVELFRNAIEPGSNVKFETRLERNIQPILCDRDSIKQILINLIKNAVEAMGNNGEIIVSSALTDKEGHPYLSLTVSDTGPGIPEALQGKLFTEVTSSKGEGHAGLGLSIVANIIQKLGGTVSHRPTFGSGATFVITLPYQTK